jgi:hypothetical protein
MGERRREQMGKVISARDIHGTYCRKGKNSVAYYNKFM